MLQRWTVGSVVVVIDTGVGQRVVSVHASVPTCAVSVRNENERKLTPCDLCQ